MDASSQVGDLFHVNLAGKRMILATSPQKQKTIATAPESVLSARQAVADIGFEEVLGYLNVSQGTDLQKRIVKALFHHSNGTNKNISQQSIVVQFLEAIQKSLQIETVAEPDTEKDFCLFIRRVLVRTIVEIFLGSFFLDDWNDFDFVSTFMKFQDDLEDVIGKSVILPRFLALPLLLRPIRYRRLQLQKMISKRLQSLVKEKNKYGFWLATVIEDNYQPDEIAEYIVGLLFAAPKNPGIGTAQSYLMLIEQLTKEEKDACIQDSKTLLSLTNPTYEQIQESCPTLNRLCLETLRLTAHSIGGVRTAHKEFKVDENLYIPKGSTVALTHISTSMNSDIWSNPKKLDLNRPMELYENDYIFSVFSHGVHICPGRNLAMIMMQCTIAILLTKYNIVLPDTIPPLCFERATLAQRASPVYVAISKK